MEINGSPSLDHNQKFAAWQLVGLLVLAFLAGIGAGFFVWGYPLQQQLATAQVDQQNAQSTITAIAGSVPTPDSGNNAAAQVDAAPTPKVTRYEVAIDGDPVLGPSDAPITLIEFSDYECPFCQKWHVEVFSKLREKYGDKIRFVYRDFPLYGMHPNAASAAESAHCAGEQDLYWEFQHLLFTGNKSLNRDTYVAYANQLSMDVPSFEQCVDDRRYQKDVEADYQYASNLGIQSTPTFFINGLAIVGAQPYQVFERIIEMELAGEIPH